jgi:hypothetical protein
MHICTKAWAGVLLVGLSAVPGFAQTANEPRGGVEIGAGATYLAVPKGVSRKMDVGGMAGLFVVGRLSTMYRLQPEIHYEYRQSKVAGSTRTFEYISIPILVRASLFKGIYILEGPAAHFPVRARVAGHDVYANTLSPDVSIVIGVGKRVGRVGLEGRWDSGIFQVQKTLEPGDVGTRHRSITGVVAVGFGAN